MAESPCLPQVQACRMRLAKLDTNGRTLAGATNLYVTKSFVSLALSPVYVSGTEIAEKNACDEVEIDYLGPDSLKRYDVTLTMLTPDPYIANFLSDGSKTISSGGRIGYASPAIGTVSGNGVSIELWAKRINSGDLDSSSPYAWWAYPKVKNLRLSPYTHDANGLKPQYVGQALENPNWFDGPTNDWPASSDRIAQWLPTATLPAYQCGPITLAAT